MFMRFGAATDEAKLEGAAYAKPREGVATNVGIGGRGCYDEIGVGVVTHAVPSPSSP